jgi:hypothetical protein
MAPAAFARKTSPIFIILRIVGLLVYIGAFFLPAVREGNPPPGEAATVIPGYKCAFWALINTMNSAVWHDKDFLTVLSGWINPLLTLYLLFLVTRHLRVPRLAIATIIFLLMIGTWVYFYLFPLVPLVGHFLWIAGILMVLAGEFAPRRQAAG